MLEDRKDQFIYKHPDSTRSLLHRLEQLNSQTVHTPFETKNGWLFGNSDIKTPVQETKPDKSKFLHLMTVEEMAEIAETQRKIARVVGELQAMQAEVFARQKEITIHEEMLRFVFEVPGA
jgi:hypothetical protein